MKALKKEHLYGLEKQDLKKLFLYTIKKMNKNG